jgi:peptidoglycan biosynthesis protein MviN/MurJ (putative lipid II flippase)
VVVSSKDKQTGKTKIKQNHTKQNKKNPTKCPKFKYNTVSVSFSACKCSSFVFSSKVGREKKKRDWRQFCEWLSEAMACLPTAVSLLLLEALFMQISRVSLTLTWPHSFCLLRILLCVSHCYKLSPFQAHWGR